LYSLPNIIRVINQGGWEANGCCTHWRDKFMHSFNRTTWKKEISWENWVYRRIWGDEMD